MGRILAIDYGTKRIGIAVTDPLKIIATGLTTVPAKNLINFLKKYFIEEDVECIVVGDPSGQSARGRNRLGEGKNVKISNLADDFCRLLKKKFPGKKIERMNEFYTSKMAFQTMIDSGLKKKDRQNKETIDRVSATIILQDYLGKIHRANDKSP